jgi:hypothetical protein
MEFLNKLTTSSTDSAKISLFLKSIGAFAVILGVDSTLIDAINVQALNFITGIGMIVSAGTALYGLLRKVKLGRWSAQ